MADFIRTFTRIRFTPLEPKIEDIKIEDIAHALSLMTRANGHFLEFYSVAQHCIHCAGEASACGCSKREVLACLLHDASEAYLADITRPVKRNLPKYLEIEEVLQKTIYEKYLNGLSKEEEETVKRIDDTLLFYEFKHYMDEEIFDEKPDMISNPDFELKNFIEVEMTYLNLFHELERKFK